MTQSELYRLYLASPPGQSFLLYDYSILLLLREKMNTSLVRKTYQEYQTRIGLVLAVLVF